ncbi:MAG: DUF952 domain-containing protein [Pseudomonadota bacterium]|jgi:uncharacterized protein (DUF952 family)
MSGPIFHFAAPADWQGARARGEYAPPALTVEGFIHAATADQVAGVVARHLRGGGPRVRLTLDVEALRPLLVFEWSEASRDLYPHVFGPIPLAAVLAADPFDPDA